MTEGEVTLEQPCMGGRKGRDGLFPASDCIKVTGYYGEDSHNKSFTIQCLEFNWKYLLKPTRVSLWWSEAVPWTLGPSPLTRRSSECRTVGHFTSTKGGGWGWRRGFIFLNNYLLRYVKGCVQSCSDVDGCNGGVTNTVSLLTLLLVLQVPWIMNVRQLTRIKL